MPSLLFHLTALDRLVATQERLPPEMARALSEDIEYARLGAALPDVPTCGGVRGGLHFIFPLKSTPVYARLFHGTAPMSWGFKMAELVANGALVGTEAGLAFVCGYFTHVCIDRVLHPIVQSLAREHSRRGESEPEARRRIAWTISLLYQRFLYGRDLLGDPELRFKFQVMKRHGLPTRGIGGGLYELIRLSSQETFNQAPPKSEVDSWVRGLFVYARLMGSPIGRRRWPSDISAAEIETLFRGPKVDIPLALERALDLSHAVLNRLSSSIARGAFSPRARQRFLDEFHDDTTEACAA